MSTNKQQKPFKGVISDVKVSEWLFIKHLTSATAIDPDIPVGLGLSVANARRWYRCDPARFAARRVAWDMTTIDLDPSGYVMADQNIIAGHVANFALMVQVLNPWCIQRNKVA